MLKAVLLLAAGALAVYAAALAFLWFRQEALLFYPQPLPPDYPLATASDVHERRVPVEGATLSMLHLRLPAPRGVVFFLHGNAGNLAGWFAEAEFFRRANFDVAMPDYRGYGKSTGRITSAHQLRADVRAAWEAVAPHYRGRPVVLYGRSLGTALAADLAQQLTAERRPPDLTVLVSPYASMRELAAEFYPWVPGALLRYPLDTASHLPQVGGPVLLVHGERDTLIGRHHAHRLQRLAPQARLVEVPGAGHEDIQAHPQYGEALRSALARL